MMNVWFELWLCMGLVWLFAISDRDYAFSRQGLPLWARAGVFLAEVVIAFALVAAPATGIIHAIHEIFK